MSYWGIAPVSGTEESKAKVSQNVYKGDMRRQP